MNKTPTNIREFDLAVLFVDYPGLIETDRLILITLALFADHKTGTRPHPGLRNLGRASAGKVGPKNPRSVERRLRFLENAGLIERTGCERGGRGKATEFRICIEHPAFQEFVPVAPKPRHNDAEVFDNKPRHDSAEVSSDKPRHADAETPACGKQTTARAPVNPGIAMPTHPLTPSLESIPPSIQQTGLEGFLLKNKPSTMAEPRDDIKAELAEYLLREGEEAMAKAFWDFEHRSEGFVGVKQPWKLLLKDLPRLLTNVKNEMAAEKRRQYIQELSEKRALVLSREEFKLPPEPAGCDIDEMMSLPVPA